jgi:hypothetical protein
MQPAFTETLDLDDTAPGYDPNAITGDYSEPRPLPVLAPRRPPTLLERIRRAIADWVSPRSYAELAAERHLSEVAIAHYMAEAHWQAHCRDRGALRHWGEAQEAQACAVERLMMVRNG